MVQGLDLHQVNISNSPLALEELDDDIGINNSVLLVRKRTIPTYRLSLLGKL
jgi:hypothetical protein